MKKFTLSHRVVASLFLVVMVLLLTIAYIGSQQTQVYRGRATYGGPTPTNIFIPSPTSSACQPAPGGNCNPGLNFDCCAGNGSCVNGFCTVAGPSPTSSTCQSTPGGVCNPGLNLPCCTGNGSCVNGFCTVPPTPMCQYANLNACQQSGCTTCFGCPDNTFTCGPRYITNTPRPPTPTNSFRPTNTPKPIPTNTPPACVPQSGACCGCGLRVNTCTGVCDRSATGGCQNWCGVPTATRSPSATPRPRPTNTPAVRPSPTEEPGSPTVLGDVNVADCTQITGWSGDTDDPNRANRVRIYADGNRTHGTLLGATRANYARERAICRALGGSNCGVCPADQPQCKHGFAFTVPANLKDGNPHTIYTYGLNLNETPGKDKKIGETKTITCTLNSPTVTPTRAPSPTTGGRTPTPTPIRPTPTRGALTPTPTTGGPTPTTPPTCGTKSTGDANCDGVVDGIDYVMWLNSQCNPGANQTCADLKADFNRDGKVNDLDYQIWFNNRT